MESEQTGGNVAQDPRAACGMLPLCQLGEGVRVQERTSQFAPVPGCSSAEGGDSGKDGGMRGWAATELTLLHTGSLSPLHAADVWVRHRLGSWPAWAERKSGATQPLGSESCLFGSRSPVFSSSPHISVQYTSSISVSHPAQVLSSPSLEVFQKSGCFQIITV